jgi:hypothetical protein
VLHRRGLTLLRNRSSLFRFVDGVFEYAVSVPTQATALAMHRSYNATDACTSADSAVGSDSVVVCAQASAYRYVVLTYDTPLTYGNTTATLYVAAADHTTNVTFTIYVFRPDAVLASLEVRVSAPWLSRRERKCSCRVR